MKLCIILPLALLVTTPFLSAQEFDPVAEAAQLSDQGRLAEASAVLQNATAANPGDEGLRLRLATALVFDRKNSEARAIFGELAASWNADIASMAVSSLAALDRAEADEKAARARSPSPEPLQLEAEYRSRQACIARQQGAYDLIQSKRDDEAVQAIDALDRRGEGTPELVMEKSAALQRMGYTLAAIVVLRDVAVADNPDPRARLQLAALLAELEKGDEAFAIWRQLRDEGGDAILSSVAAAESDALEPPYSLERWTRGELDIHATYLSRYKTGIASWRLLEGTFVPRPRWSLNNWSPVRFRADWFVEAGDDAAYYKLPSDGLAYGQSRQGVRVMQFGKAAAVDTYALENLSMDTWFNYYDNDFEADLGLRVVTSRVGAAVLTTSADYVLGSYLSRNNNTRGDTAANYSDSRLTLPLSVRW